MDVCRSWFRRKSGLARCADENDSSARKCSSLPASARQFTFGCDSSSSSSSSSDTPTRETPLPGRTCQSRTQDYPKKELLSKKERRDLLKARVEALRSRLRDSSTDEDESGTPTPFDGIKRTRSKSQSDDAIKETRTRASRAEKFLRRSRNPVKREIKSNQIAPTVRTWSLDRRQEESCSMYAERRKFYRAPPPPPPPPRTTKITNDDALPPPPPPPPTRHNQRPISFAFENGLGTKYHYDVNNCDVTKVKSRDETGANISRFRCPNRGFEATGVYLSDSQTGKRTKPVPPAVPPRRGSLQVITSPPPHNLEDALQELERIYCTLKTKDEVTEINKTKSEWTTSNLKRMSRMNVSASVDSLVAQRQERDDLACRRIRRNNRPPTPASLPPFSYILVAPHLSPTDTPETVKTNNFAYATNDPDTVKDDVSFRAMRDANRVTAQEKTPFGIPGRSINSSPNATDYLRPAGIAKERNTFQHRFTADVVQDDMAIRNLRKDVGGTVKSTNVSKVNTDELDAILKSNETPTTASTSRRKYRAMRSLSANISHLVLKRQSLSSSWMSTSQSTSDLLAAIAADDRGNGKGKSTDTLTECEEKRKDNIWQIRVSDGDVSTQLTRSRRTDSESELIRQSQKGNPINETSLDELLNSLGEGADQLRDRRKVDENKGDFYARPSFKSAVGLRNSSPSQQGQKLMGGNQSCTKGQRESNHAVAAHDASAERGKEINDENKERTERMNKYKERRRRQLASKYADWSSSEDITSVGDEPSFVRFSNKYQRHSKPNAMKISHDQENGATEETSVTSAYSGIVRSNRASRLRALTVGGQENTTNNDLIRSTSFHNKNDDRFQRGISNRRSFNGIASSTSEWNGKNNSSSQTFLSSSDTASTCDSTPKSRDKSGKRKSNLNRSLLAEVNQTLRQDANPEQRWHRANDTDKLSGVVLSEGNSPRPPLRADLDFKTRDKQSSMKRPQIPPIFLQNRGNRTERDLAATGSDSGCRNSNSAMTRVDSIGNNAASRVNQLTQLVEETTTKVDTLTYIAAGSSDSVANLRSPLVKSEGGSSATEASDKFASVVPQAALGEDELRNGTVFKYTMETESTSFSSCAGGDARLDSNRPDKSESDLSIGSRIIVPLPVLNKNAVDEVKSCVATPPLGGDEIYAAGLSSNRVEGRTKSHSILKSSDGASDAEELPHHGILKRTSSSDGGDPKPILKKRSSIDETNDQPKPILKIHRNDDTDGNTSSTSSKFSCEEHVPDGNTDLRPILKRQHRQNEPPPSSILKVSSAGEKRFAIEKKEDEENRNSTSECEGEVALLPSILKKKCKEVHPLANPFTELASILKPKQATRVPAKTPIEIFHGSDDQRRMSVAERIIQMETKLADEAEGTPTSPSIAVKDSVIESGCSTVTEASLRARFDGISNRRVRERYSARYHTQPITFSEVKNSTFNNESTVNGVKETSDGEMRVETQLRATVSVQRSQIQTAILSEVYPTDQEPNSKQDDSDEDPCKMSLAERVSFFDRKVLEEKLARNKSAETQHQYSRKRNSSRFKTQPITIAEVEKAQQIEMGEKATDTNDWDNQLKRESDPETNDTPLVCHSPPKVHPPIPRGKATIILSSSNDEDSSGPGFQEGRRVIKNDAINRRRNAALRRQDERRSMCDLYSGVGTEPLRTNNLHQRSNTAPLTKFELDKHEESAVEVVSIADRLAALRKRGEESWRERIPNKDETLLKKQTTTVNNTADGTESDVGTYQRLASIREKRRSRENRPSSIVDRISQLGVAQEGWKQRVEEKDSTQFTVAGRMGCVDSDSQIVERTRHTPAANVFTTNSPMMIPLQRSVSEPVCNIPCAVANVNRMSRVLVPKIDDESFHAFFGSTNQSSTTRVEISDDGFQHMTTTSRQMLVQKKDVARQRRTAASSRNPIKMLASRSDIQNEYEENVTELNKLRAQQIAKTTNLALSALAGLASSEDFSSVSLKKGSQVPSGSLLPFKDLMLIQIKGRRHVQTRLVEPTVSSMNRGDNYILVTPNQVFNWIGRFSNVIERSKGSELASTIQSKHDLGYSSGAPVVVIDEERASFVPEQDAYFKVLGGDVTNVSEAGNPKEDELYETAIIDTNMVYEVDVDRLVPHPKCWGTLPKIELLEANKVLVFDFGSEMYVWQGKLAPISLRKNAVCLAQELWNQGYNYSECIINPLCPTLTGVKEGLAKHQNERPAWCLFAKVNQHMETILFREKFVDWPESQNIIKVKSPEKNRIASASPLGPCDARVMLEDSRGEPDLILEGSHIGRGKSYRDGDSRRHYEITTLGIKVWHVVENSYKLLPRESWSQFYSGDTNVVRWQYTITVTGRDLSGQMSRHSFVGRERCAYFFWQGAESTVNDKGVSALMTIELNEERGPHIRVNDGHEPPCFLGLFDGAMMVHRGRRKLAVVDQDLDDDDQLRPRCLATRRLYVLRNPIESESCLIEVEPIKSSLRSRSSLVFVDVGDGLICVWHGAKSTEQLKQAAYNAANILRERRPFEIGFECHLPIRLTEVSEGEDESLLSLLECANKADDRCCSYRSLQTTSLSFDFTPRLFHMSSVSGTFSAVEITCAFRSSHFSCPFPFVQSDLYDTDQPALFILDDKHRVYLWQGWWPEATDYNDNIATGSAKVRWNTDRRCAMETVLNYCREKNGSSPPPAYLVSAGLEPLSFTNLFPSWETRDDVTALNSQDGRKEGECIVVDDVLTHLSRTRFTLQELQNNPLPEGVDPSRIESYLNESDFEEVMGMTPTEFYILPAWKQSETKKSAHLF